MALQVTRDVLDAMADAARSADPQEACGILFGEGERITRFTQTENAHTAPQTHFEIDPQALIDAYRRQREGGPAILGYFHSHPSGLAEPSKTDRALAAHDGLIWAIHANGDTTFWRDDVSGFKRLSYGLVRP